MPTTCEIIFDHSDGVYYSGQDLKGIVKLVTCSEKSVRAIRITVKGCGKVEWDDGPKLRAFKKPQNCTSDFSAKDKYLLSSTNVFGSDGRILKLPKGTHEYTFSSFLPHDLPSSFTGNYGRIKYEVVVTINEVWKFYYGFKKPFTVIKNVDLSLNSRYLLPLGNSEEMFFWCCAWGPIKAMLWTSSGGYIPGELLKYMVYIENESNTEVFYCNARFMQYVIYESRSPYKKTRKDIHVLSFETLEGALSFSKRQIMKDLLIPAIPPTTFCSDAIIKIEYCLSVQIVSEAFHRYTELSVPIVIGTISCLGNFRIENTVITNQPTMHLPHHTFGHLNSFATAWDNGPSHNAVVTEEPTAIALPTYPSCIKHIVGGNLTLLNAPNQSSVIITEGSTVLQLPLDTFGIPNDNRTVPSSGNIASPTTVNIEEITENALPTNTSNIENAVEAVERPAVLPLPPDTSNDLNSPVSDNIANQGTMISEEITSITTETAPLYVRAVSPNAVVTLQPSSHFSTSNNSDNDDPPPPYSTVSNLPSFEEATGIGEFEPFTPIPRRYPRCFNHPPNPPNPAKRPIFPWVMWF